MVRMLLIFSFLFNFTNFGFSNDEIDPIGEKSDLVLVKDRSRTTSGLDGRCVRCVRFSARREAGGRGWPGCAIRWEAGCGRPVTAWELRA